MNSEALFSMALGLKSPWQVKDVTFSTDESPHTVRAHWSGIVHFVESHITNGILEGINSKIQLAKLRARGYRNINNFINMIYFLCGKLKFDYPLYFT